MITVFESIAFSDDAKFVFPKNCIYCNGLAEEYIDFSIHQPFDLGNYTLDLADKFRLPTSGSKRIKGFEITIRSSSIGSGHRTLHFDCKGKMRVPYCKEHIKLKQEIEQKAEPGTGLVLSFVIPLLIVSIYLRYVNVISISADESWYNVVISYLFAFALGVIPGYGLAFLIHKLFGNKGPKERVHYLKSSWTGSGAESLGWRCDFGANPKSPYEFLENPSIKVIHEFTNADYAKAFAKFNSGIIKSK